MSRKRIPVPGTFGRARPAWPPGNAEDCRSFSSQPDLPSCSLSFRFWTMRFAWPSIWVIVRQRAHVIGRLLRRPRPNFGTSARSETVTLPEVLTLAHVLLQRPAVDHECSFVCIFNLYSTSHLASCGQGRKDGLPLGSVWLRAAGGNIAA